MFRATVQDQIRDRFPEDRAELESMPAEAAGNDHVSVVRVVVDHEMSVFGEGVQAHFRMFQGSACRRDVLVQVAQQEGLIRGIDGSTNGVRITGITIAVPRDLRVQGAGKVPADWKPVLEGLRLVRERPDRHASFGEEFRLSRPGPAEQLAGRLQGDSRTIDESAGPCSRYIQGLTNELQRAGT